MMNEQIFYGLFHVKPLSDRKIDRLQGAIGAYVCTTALAVDENTFIELAKSQFRDWDLYVEEFEDICSFDRNISLDELHEEQFAQEVIEMITALNAQNPIETFFHTYANDDED